MDPACADLVYPSHIQVFIGDQTHSPTLHRALTHLGSSDYGHPGSIMALLTELADDLHGAHHTSGQRHTPWSSLGAIHIYDSIAFIHKAEREMPRAWRMPTERTTAVPASG